MNTAAKPSEHSIHHRQKGRGGSVLDYLPLVTILAITMIGAGARQWAGTPPPGIMSWMHDFMGFFLLIFAMVKLFDLSGFADGFQMYDLLAGPVRSYSYLYPFIELALGLGYLSRWQPPVVYAATIVVLGFGSLGVLNALRKGLDLECACMGTILKVPLSTVALIEDVGMAGMAAVMWFVS